MNIFSMKNIFILTIFSMVNLTSYDYANNTYYSLSFSSIKYDAGVIPVSGSILLDDRSFGYKLKTGNMITDNFAMELFYADYGETSVQGNAGDQFIINSLAITLPVNSASVTLGHEAFGVNAVYFKSLNRSLTFMARLGILSWSSDLLRSYSTTISNNGKDTFYSLGLEQEFSDATSIILEYEQIKFGDVDVDSLSFAFALKF